MYGLTTQTRFPSFISVRPKRSMDTGLWTKFNDTVIAPCYPNVAKEVTRCPVTNKILSGPLILKTDAGPGRLSKDAESWEFRERMHDKGLVILLGLPNGTAATQEMDQGYTDLKKETKKSTMRAASRKMAARVRARTNSTTASAINLRSDDESDDESNDEHDECATARKRSSCNVSLGNLDLGNIVNGFRGDPVEYRPFTLSLLLPTSRSDRRRLASYP